MNIKQYEEEIKKGCGEFLGEYHYGEKIRCGDFIFRLRFCQTCQAKLEAIKKYKEMVKEMIEKVNESSLKSRETKE